MDHEFLGDRRRALEEQYFAKHNRALLEHLRASREGADKRIEGGEGADAPRDDVPCADEGGSKSPRLAETGAPKLTHRHADSVRTIE